MEQEIKITPTSTLDASWIQELQEILGDNILFTGQDQLHDHSYDYWPVAIKWRRQGKQPYRPQAIVRPENSEQITILLRWATENHIPVTPWGAGSGVTGAALPMNGGVILDMSAMDRTLLLDETNLLVTVQAGKMGHLLEQELNERGFTLNHSPQSLDRSTVGGWIATRATGQFSSRWGGIEDLVIALTAVLPTGEIVKIKPTPRASTGPDLKHIFMGSEGTTGVVTEIILKMFPLAEYRRFETLAFDTVEQGLLAMRQIMQVGLKPFLVRFYDEDETRHAIPDTDTSYCAMFLGFEGIEEVAQAEYSASMQICIENGGRKLGPNAVLAWMDRRFDFSTIETRMMTPGGVAETIEIAHFWDSIFETYMALKTALASQTAEVLGHFSHVYPHGTSMYMILLGNEENDSLAEQRLLEIWDVAMKICLETGAAISHHHGIGLARLPYIREEQSSSAILLARIKSAIDPAGIMNPGKLALPAETDAA